MSRKLPPIKNAKEGVAKATIPQGVTATPIAQTKGPPPPRRLPQPFDPSQLPPGWAAVVSHSSVVIALQGPNPSLPSSGYGGWSYVKRPKRVSVTQYEGRDGTQQSLNLMIDGYDKDWNIENHLWALEMMALSSRNEEPPLVKIYGKGIPHTDKLWVINDIQWGSEVAFTPNLERSRQEVTLSLMEFISDEHIIAIKPAARKTVDCSKARSKTKTYIVKQGDTLASIAAKLLGSSSCAKQIQTLNKIRDPKKIKKGQKLKIP